MSAARKTFVPFDNLMNVEIVRGPTSDGGMLLPEGVQLDTPIVRVIARGPKCEQVQEGDYVLVMIDVNRLKQNCFVRHDGQETFIVREDQIMGVLLTTPNAEIV